MQPATIKLFLINGSPTGLRTAEISNWTGKAIAGPRSDLDDLLRRPELQSPGVYLLTGTDSESGDPVLYVGEAENVSKRLKQHAKTEEKDYWVHTSAFVSKDDNLTKSHIKYIEGKLIQLAHSSKRMIVMNSVSSGSSLPEADRAEMDIFIQKILQLLPVLGIHQFSVTATLSPFQSNPKASIYSDEVPLFHIKSKGVTASGRRSEEGFTVFKGSLAVKLAVKACPAGVVKSRERLLEKGVIALNDDHFVFTEDYEFSSPSTAAAFVQGGSVNGLTAWVNGENQTLKSFESQ